jgi:hypothetical protein
MAASLRPKLRGHPVRMGAPGRGDFHTALRTEEFEWRGELLEVAVKPNENTQASLISAGRSRDSKGVGCGSDYPSSRHICRLPAQACFPGCRDMKTRSLRTHAPKNRSAELHAGDHRKWRHPRIGAPAHQHFWHADTDRVGFDEYLAHTRLRGRHLDIFERRWLARVSQQDGLHPD